MVDPITGLPLGVAVMAAGGALFRFRKSIIRANYGLNTLIGARYARVMLVCDRIWLPLMALMFCAAGVSVIVYTISRVASGH